MAEMVSLKDAIPTGHSQIGEIAGYVDNRAVIVHDISNYKAKVTFQDTNETESVSTKDVMVWLQNVQHGPNEVVDHLNAQAGPDAALHPSSFPSGEAPPSSQSVAVHPEGPATTASTPPAKGSKEDDD